MAQQTVNDFFVYAVEVASLAAAANSTQQFNVEADSDFTLVKMACFADIAGAVQTDSSRVLPLVTLSIFDSGSGRNLQNVAFPLSNIAGSNGLPFVLPIPRLFKARSTVSLTFTNYSAATTYANLYLTLIGFKTFYL